MTRNDEKRSGRGGETVSTKKRKETKRKKKERSGKKEEKREEYPICTWSKTWRESSPLKFPPLPKPLDLPSPPPPQQQPTMLTTESSLEKQ